MKPSDKQLGAARASIADAHLGKGLSSAEIARKTGVQPSQVGRICRGEFKTFSHSVLQICNVLDVKLRDLELEHGEANSAWARVQSSIRRIWDGTPEGTMTIVRMLDAIAELRTKRRS